MRILIEQIAVVKDSQSQGIVYFGMFDDKKVIGESSVTISLVGINNNADFYNAVIGGINDYATKNNLTIASSDIIWPAIGKVA